MQRVQDKLGKETGSRFEAFRLGAGMVAAMFPNP
jgi:hypothetical protein